MKPPSFDEFAELATQGNVIPIAESMLADLLTPVSAFLKLCGENEQGFLLESVEGGEQIARYSFLGRKPAEWISYDGQQVKVTSSQKEETLDTDIFSYLQSLGEIHIERYAIFAAVKIAECSTTIHTGNTIFEGSGSPHFIGSAQGFYFYYLCPMVPQELSCCRTGN